jgi:hypothetical protein
MSVAAESRRLDASRAASRRADGAPPEAVDRLRVRFHKSYQDKRLSGVPQA